MSRLFGFSILLLRLSAPALALPSQPPAATTRALIDIAIDKVQRRGDNPMKCSTERTLRQRHREELVLSRITHRHYI